MNKLHNSVCSTMVCIKWNKAFELPFFLGLPSLVLGASGLFIPFGWCHCVYVCVCMWDGNIKFSSFPTFFLTKMKCFYANTKDT